MDRADLTHPELQVAHREMARTHERRIHFELQTLDGRTVGWLTKRSVDGGVTIDVHRIPTRILDCRLLDRRQVLQFEPDAPGEGPLHRRYRIKVYDSRRIVGLGRWVTWEVFTGPIWDFDREGPMVSLVAHGMERQAMGAKWDPQTWKRKTRKTDIIRELLAAAGDPGSRIPDLKITTPERISVTEDKPIWPPARRLAKSMDRHLFYPGHGDAVLRKPVKKPVFTFDERHLLSEVKLDRNPDGVFNTFEVLGAKPKGSKKRIRAVVSLPDHHPNSAVSLARNGKPCILLQREENPHFKHIAEAHARAVRLRDDASKVQVTYEFDAIPIPHLEEWDTVRVRSGEGTIWVPIRQLTLPLGWDGAPPMTVGALKSTMPASSGSSGKHGMGWKR